MRQAIGDHVQGRRRSKKNRVRSLQRAVEFQKKLLALAECLKRFVAIGWSIDFVFRDFKGSFDQVIVVLCQDGGEADLFQQYECIRQNEGVGHKNILEKELQLFVPVFQTIDDTLQD